MIALFVCLLLTVLPRKITSLSLQSSKITGTSRPLNFALKASNSLDESDAGTLKKLQKIEAIKLNSEYLRVPLEEEMKNDEVFVSNDAVIVLKYHGSYMQDNRDNRKKGEKEYSFMLRLKSPCGEIPPELYKKLDYLSDTFGQGDLRATTRQAWQLHGILKGDLKTVISTIIEAGSSTIGACGDVSRNVMCPPAPFVSSEYTYARQYSKIMAELFKPQSNALTELWLGEDKVADIEYWMKDLERDGISNIKEAMLKDNGKGIITSDKTEPLYGNRYLPKKFKVAVTVPGDNSLDIYTNDIGLVVITNNDGKLKGFNVIVGGGMGRTHMKDSTFARVGDHLGFVAADDVLELCKAILATQRDHGNREIRANSRMKYLVHELGIEKFRSLVEGYFGKSIQPWIELPPWEYKDWMGWHEQGDGNLFLGINVEQGRVKDEGGFRLKSALKKIVDELNLTMVLSPTQSIIFKDIKPELKQKINHIFSSHGIKHIESVDPLVRLSMACPALPLCGLAVTEAERRMPDIMLKIRILLDRLGLGQENIMTRVTGCPNGCARPYMGELALVGDGPDMYQVWLGGSPNLTRLAKVYTDKMKYSDLENVFEKLFSQWRDNRVKGEAFGDFCNRLGVANLVK